MLILPRAYVSQILQGMARRRQLTTIDKRACFSLRERREIILLSVQCLEQPNEFGRHKTFFRFISFVYEIFLYQSCPALFASHSVSNNVPFRTNPN